jgi:S-DNA-T family DNA segregation ATPase FtsK/SpoIIIE
MMGIFSGFSLADYLPEPLARRFSTMRRQSFGMALLGLGVAMGLALVTWSVGDPSFNHDSQESPRNLLGFPGAAFSDLAVQFFGIAAFLLAVLPLFWGLRLIVGIKVTGKKWRLPLYLVSLLFLCAFAASLKKPAEWPLPTGLGGYVGDIFYNLPLGLTRPLFGSATPFVIGLTALILGLLSLKIAAGIRLRQAADFEEYENDEIDEAPWLDEPQLSKNRRAKVAVSDADEDDTSWHPLGLTTHYLLSFKALIRRSFGAKPKTVINTEQNERKRRIEPALEGHGYQEPAFEDDYEDEDNWQEPLDDENDWDEVFDAAHSSQNGQGRDASGNIVAFPKGRKAPAVGEHKQQLEGARKSELRRKARTVNRFVMPPLELLTEPQRKAGKTQIDETQLQENASELESVLQDFGVRGEIIQVRPGPVVTLYELEPAPGTKSSRVIGLADDIARSMSAISARVAVVPGRNAIGIELPNDKRETVLLRELLASKAFVESRAKLPLCLGKTIGGEPVIADLARMPHLLIAGTTGSGKSVAINTMILSLLYRLPPEQCRVIMVDPKMLELSVYDGIPHLLSPVVTDPKKAVVALKWAVREMEDRYKKMSKLGVRNIDGFNARVAEAAQKGETVSRTVQTGFDPGTGEAIYETEELQLESMPYLVVIVDEMADLMMVAGKDIEGAIQRLAQMARAAGIHLIMATQRPSVDVITGTIKANFPTRISFQVTSKIDSRTILGEQGAEQLLGQGDMLYMMGGGRIARVHGPFVADEEVEDVVAHLKSQGVPDYLEDITADDSDPEYGDGDDSGYGDSGDELYDRAVAIVIKDKKASTSYIQRRLSIGYNRAATLIERMENEGLISSANHAGKREILVNNGHDD